MKFQRTAVKQAALVTSLQMLLALIATYPLIGSIGTTVIGGGDSAQNVWNLWWVRQAASQGNVFPFFTNMIYYPAGVSLAYHPLGVLNGWAGIILQNVLGISLISTYNVLLIGTFVLTGLATFYLVNSLVENSPIAFVASIIFTYAPIRVSRVVFGNLEIFSTEFVPLAALCVIKLFQTHQRRYAVLAALAIAATTWLSLYLAIGTALLIAMLAGLLLIEKKSLVIPRLKLMSLTAFMTLMLVAPVIVPMIQNFQAFRDQSDQLTAASLNSADLLGFFIPDNETAPLIKQISPEIANFISKIYAAFLGNAYEKTVFIGYSVLALILFTGVFARSRAFKIWLIMGSVFFILCLGPQLHVAGKSVGIHLPYEWLNQVPLIGFGRVPSRLAIFLMLALAVASGLGLKSLQDRYNRPTWVIGIIGVVVFMEFLVIPMNLDMRFTEIPAYYLQSRGPNEVQTAVLDIPIDLIGAQGPAGDYMLYQTVHQRPIVSGYISRTPRYVLELFQRPFMNELRARIYNDKAPYHFDQQVLSRAKQELSELNIGTVILHRDKLSSKDFVTLYTALVDVLAEPDYADDQVTVWEVNR